MLSVAVTAGRRLVGAGRSAAASVLLQINAGATTTLSSSSSGAARALSSNAAAPAYLGPPRDDYVPLSLNTIAPNPGATSQKRRVGRGIGSGRGKTCKRGHKGKKARQGGSVALGFEGGQTPLQRRLPKRGFNNGPNEDFDIVSVDRILQYVAMGRLPVPGPEPTLITMKDLLDAGVVTSIKHGLKLVGGSGSAAETAENENDETENTLPRGIPRDVAALPLHLEVSGASASAIQAVEVRGGSVTCAHFNRLALRALLKPHKFAPLTPGRPLLPRRARPPPKLMPRFLSWDRRGYLSPEVQLRNLKLFGRVTSEQLPPLAGEQEALAAEASQ